MLSIALPMIITFVVLVILAFGILLILFIWSRFSLEHQARKISDDNTLLYRTPDGDYYDHKYKKRDWIEIRANRLVYTRDKAFLRKRQRTVINLNHIMRSHVYFFTVFIQTKNGEVYRIPTGFENQDEIYSAIKYHRTNNGRRSSTR